MLPLRLKRSLHDRIEVRYSRSQRRSLHRRRRQLERVSEKFSVRGQPGSPYAQSPSAAAAGCDCSEKWQASDARLAKIEQSIADLKLITAASQSAVDDLDDNYVRQGEIDQYAKKSDVPQLVPLAPIPDVSGLATKEEVAAVATAAGEADQTILDRLRTVAGKAKAAGAVVIAAKDAAVAGGGGLLAGWSFGAQLAAILGVSTGPAGIAGLVVYQLLKRRVRKRRRASSGGSSQRTFP